MDWSSHHIAAAGLIAVAAFTPGPNNVIVMHRAAVAGLRGTAPAIAGVVAGSLLLLAVVALGGDAVFAAAPWARRAIAVAGALILGWAGVSMLASSFRAPTAATPGAPPPARAGFATLAALQLFNPKSWLMVVTAVSTAPAAGALQTFAGLAPLFVVIPVAGLLSWSALGAALRRAHAATRWLDRGMGTLLVASAVMLWA